MPVYTYRCLDCGLTLDVRHGMDETHNESCEGCEGVVRKYFGNIQFDHEEAPRPVPPPHRRDDLPTSRPRRTSDDSQQNW